MYCRKLSWVLLVVFSFCALSCVAQGVERLRASQSCHDDSDSQPKLNKSCCKQAVVEQAFRIAQATEGIIRDTENIQLVTVTGSSSKRAESRRHPPDLYQLETLRI